jgi:hypothetical protein
MLGMTEGQRQFFIKHSRSNRKRNITSLARIETELLHDDIFGVKSTVLNP